MGHRVGTELLGELYLLLRDQRTRDRRAEQILPLIHRVGAKHRKHVIADEFLAYILDEDILRLDAEQQRFLARRLRLLTLAEIGGEGHDLAAVGGLQPLQDDRGVEAARIGEHYLLDVLAHENPVELDTEFAGYAQMITGRKVSCASVHTDGAGPTSRPRHF